MKHKCMDFFDCDDENRLEVTTHDDYVSFSADEWDDSWEEYTGNTMVHLNKSDAIRLAMTIFEVYGISKKIVNK